MKLNLNTTFLGKNNIYYDKIDSTQSEIWRQYENNAVNGTLVIAELQTAGIGTHGRKWYTNSRGNIAFSFLIKPECNIKKLDGITLEIANIIVSIFEEKYNIKLNIKEPNDIVYNDKKIGGILTQTKVINENVKALVIGIGINTNEQVFCDEIVNTASSINREFGVDVNVQEFIEEFCKKFEDLFVTIYN